MKNSDKRIYTFGIAEDLIANIARYVTEQMSSSSTDLSRVAIVFGGRRPSLFLKRLLAEKIKGPFFPPAFFTMDEFIREVVGKKYDFTPISDIDSSYRIYTLARKTMGDIASERNSFALFLPWAEEILSFIEQLDIEDISENALRSVQSSAAIGYDVPENINGLLQNINELRKRYHESLVHERRFNRGLMYLEAARSVKDVVFEEYDEILFCGLFYLNATEREVIKDLYDRGKATLFFQGDERDWPTLQENARHFGTALTPEHFVAPKYEYKLFAGSDTHSQVAMAREIVQSIPCPDQTAMIVPEADAIIPLLSELAGLVKNINVSLGYPLKRSSLYSLLEYVFAAQRSKKMNGDYYTRDYLRTLRHPLIKNLRIPFEPAVTRVIVHAIEEELLGKEGTEADAAVAARNFIPLKDIQTSSAHITSAKETLSKLDIFVEVGALESVVKALHALLFTAWENITTLRSCMQVLKSFIEKLVSQSFLTSYPLNTKVIEKVFALIEELGQAQFAEERFPQEDLFRIILDRISNDVISFSGTPLKGFQMLGVLEARSLSFENVIIMDVNESIMPKLRVTEPLIPREIMVSLGLRRFEKEEEIQRYGFMRLISSAKNVYLVYSQDPRRERSRFIEDLIWEKQKKTKKLEKEDVVRAAFPVNSMPEKMPKQKTTEIAEYIRTMRYSATRVNTYLECPMKFYFQYVLGLKERQDLTQEPEGADIGIFIHNVLNESFKCFLGKKPEINDAFTKKFTEYANKEFDRTLGQRMGPDAFLVKEVIDHRLRHFLEQEKVRPVKEIISLEGSFSSPLTVSGKAYVFEARVDRIDRLEDGSLLIIDYKTGGLDIQPKSNKTLEKLTLDRTSILDTIGSFQLPLYVHLVSKHYPNETIDAALYNLRTATLSRFFKDPEEIAKAARMNACVSSLELIVKEMNDPQVPFSTDETNTNKCAACPFFYACR